MTRYLLDVASYQGALSPAAVKAAGFSAVNLKISHGLTRKSVHPNLGGWIDQARSLGLGISTFHFMTADADGAAQAEYAYALIRDLGLLYGTAHQLDVESDPAPALSSVRGYLERMGQLLGRPAALYTGDWWWKPQGWNVADLTPYLWSAPNAGYLANYPGDSSQHWVAGYGGWAKLAVMQYAVKALAGIDVSMSAIRDPAVWTALTEGRSGVSYAPTQIKEARALILKTLPKMDPLSVGIVGDDSHAASGSSYHLGKDALKPGSYSVVESGRDKHPTNAAMALDFGWFSIKVDGTTYTLRHFSAWVVAECKAGASDTRDLREVIYSLDGNTVKRWDRLGIRTTGDSSHLSHTHLSWFRDSEDRDKTALFRRYFTEIGLLEGDDMNAAEMTAWAKSADGREALASAAWTAKFGTDSTEKRWPGNGQQSAMNFLMLAAMLSFDGANATAVGNLALNKVLANVQADDGDAQNIIAQIQQTQAAVLEGLGGSGRSDAELADIVRRALGDRATSVAALIR